MKDYTNCRLKHGNKILYVENAVKNCRETSLLTLIF